MSLEALLRAARDNEPRAWDALSAQLSTELQNYFSRWYQVADAKDLAQDTTVIILEKLPGFEPERSFEGWVFGIARNVSRAGFRAERWHAALRGALAQERPAPATGMSSQLRRAEIEQLVRDEIEQLPDHFRSVLEHDLEDGSPRDYAEVHGLDIRTVRTRRHRATRQLEGRLREKLQTPSPPVSPASPPTPSS